MHLLSLLSICLAISQTTALPELGDQEILFSSQESPSECHNACTALLNRLGSPTVHYEPVDQLAGFRDGFYSTFQREIIPACITTPSAPSQVADAIKIIRNHGCIFAVKSGGHAMFEGASNANGGITIDLRLLNQLEFVGEEKGIEGETTRIGPGARWREVYKSLEPLNRTVVGGRNSHVGVGGFILGGGISFVSRRYGWALDNVRNFEVVLANGSLTNINQASSPDLYFALRGGGNNFGIVTRFDLETHPQGPVFGGHNFWPVSHDDIAARKVALTIPQHKYTFTLSSALQLLSSSAIRVGCKFGYCVNTLDFLKALENVVIAEQSDPYAQLYTSFGYAAQLNTYIIGGALVYSKPEKDPEVFKEFKALSSRTVHSTNRITNFTDIYEEVDRWNEIGFRQEWAALTIGVSAELMSKILDIFIEEVEPIKGVKDVIPSIVFQPINRDEIRLFSKNGGNCLGIEPGEGPFILFSTVFSWSLRTDDPIMKTANSNIITRTTALAKSMHLHHRYIYQNYANISQDVFAGYGEENRLRLRGIQQKYDPEGVFSRLQPGYFKV